MKKPINLIKQIPFFIQLVLLIFLSGNFGHAQITLHTAVKNGDINQTDSLIADSADVNENDKTSWSPLMYALKFNHLAIVKLLVENNADVNFKDNNDITPLMNASRFGYYDIAEFLINNGADANVKNKNGSTALMYAISQNQTEIIALLEKIENVEIVEIIKENPEVLESPKDIYGIPEKLYSIDSKLFNYKSDIINTKNSNNRRGKNWIIFGSIYTGCGILLTALSGGKGNYELTLFQMRTGIDIFDFGIFTTCVGVAIGTIGIFIKTNPVSTKELKDYYNNQYGKYFEVGLRYKF